MTIRLELHTDPWPMREPFRTARGLITEIPLLVATLHDEQGRLGRGEAVGVPYDGETIDTMSAQLLAVADRLAADGTAFDPARRLPPGGARNALDCALWDLRAKQAGKRAWQLAGVPNVEPVTTALTLSISPEDEHRRHVREARHLPLLKLKVDRTQHLQQVRIAREEHPTARLLVDANQSWDRALLDELAPAMAGMGVELIEQPVTRGTDETLRGYDGPVVLAADESCTDRQSLDRLVGLYGLVSIKLEKTGGLTEALAVADRATELGFGLMVGNMGGTSLSMASHFLVAQRCRYVDLDAPLIIRGDREHAMRYEGALLHPPAPELWG